MALFRREGFREDDYLIRDVEEMGIGREVPAAAALDGSCVLVLEVLIVLREGFEEFDGIFKLDCIKECSSIVRGMV